MMGRRQYSKNSLFCEACLHEPGEGAEVEITMRFADMRGSTTLPEKMSASDFGNLRKDVACDKLHGAARISIMRLLNTRARSSPTQKESHPGRVMPAFRRSVTQ